MEGNDEEHDVLEIESDCKARRRAWFAAASVGDAVALARMHALQPDLIDQVERLEVRFFSVTTTANLVCACDA